MMDQGGLVIDSMFECGNIDRAVKERGDRYVMYMTVDTNTKGHQQWFYFKVKNTRKGGVVEFVINNFTKPYCLYKNGMKVNVYSKCRNAQKSPSGWEKGGENIEYARNEIQRSGWRRPGPINYDDEEDDDQY